MHKAATKGSELAEADPDYGERKMGRTPLWEAAWSGHTTMMRSLIDARAKVDAVTTGGPAPGKSALMIAAQRGQFDAVRLLFDVGASKELKDKKDCNASDCAREGLARKPQAQRVFNEILRLLS